VATTADAPRRRRARLAAAILVGTLAIFAATLWSGAGDRTGLPRWAGGAGLPSPFSTMPEARSVAVLPFVDTSDEQDQDYFSDGFSEEILNTLAQISDLRVTARTSSFYFKGRNLPVREVARQLGVSTVLEGSVHRAGDRVRVTARLIDAGADRPIRARTFDRDLEDLYAIQSEIAEMVTGAFQIDSPEPGARIPTPSLAAHESYLRGLFHWNRRTPNDLRLAIGFFEEAIRIDPDYAHPHAGIALAYVVQFHDVTDDRGGEELLALVETSAGRALALDPSIAQAHAARAYAYSWRWRWTEAELEFHRAIDLNPGYSTAHQWYGEHLAKAGRPREAVESVQHAIALDPLSLVASNDLGLVLMINGDYPAAVEQFERTLGMDAGFPIPLYLLHRTHLAAGNVERAAEAVRRWAELSGMVDAREVVTIVRAIADPALRPTALAILGDWERHERPRWFDIMTYYVYLGETDRAIDLLEAGISERLPMLGSARVNPWLDPIRPDPRVQRALAGMEIL
jgi:TolB-like protein